MALAVIRFNGAGLIQPGGLRTIVRKYIVQFASMGPGLFSPEDQIQKIQRRVKHASFNGAGLIQPGGLSGDTACLA